MDITTIQKIIEFNKDNPYKEYAILFFLLYNNVYDKFVFNISKEYKEEEFHVEIHSDIICSAVNWSNTIDGSIFWSNISDSWEATYDALGLWDRFQGYRIKTSPNKFRYYMKNR